MSKTKKYITAASTFSVALGIGFVMQYGDALASRWGADSPVTGPATQAAMPDMVVVPVTASIAMPTVLSLPSGPEPSPVVPASLAVIPADIATPGFDISVDATPAPVEEITLVAAQEPATDDIEMVVEDPIDLVEACDITLTATPSDLAMVHLDLSSPCRTEQFVAIHHQGMMFSGLTDAEGQLHVTVPALHEEAFFIAAFDDGNGAVAVTGVPDLAMFDRAVLQWQGQGDVQLHALEFGATYGEDGHVWAASASDTDAAMSGQSGFLARLGHAAAPLAMMAEVYTYPSGLAARNGEIVLTVEAEVTERNCGREITAQTIQIGPGMDDAPLDLAMTMPGCDAVGEFLVLKNMIKDLTLASK